MCANYSAAFLNGSAKFLLAMLVLLGGLIVAPQANAQDTPTGKCVLAENTKTSPDGRCGTWTVSNSIDSKTKKPTPITLIDFSHVTNDFPNGNSPALPLTIVRVCVPTAHNSFDEDWLIVESTGSRHKASNQTWMLDSKATGCRYWPLRPGMKITVRMTNILPDKTQSGLGASGTWAIVK